MRELDKFKAILDDIDKRADEILAEERELRNLESEINTLKTEKRSLLEACKAALALINSGAVKYTSFSVEVEEQIKRVIAQVER